MAIQYTVPGLNEEDALTIIDLLQVRLSCYNDLHLTLKHVHWNVVGRSFIGVHEMIDPQVEEVRAYADVIAERIAALGGSPKGTPSQILKDRTWDDYSLNRGLVKDHLVALDKVYDGVITDNRKVIEQLDELDLVTQDLLISQTGELEKFQWFVRAHLEDAQGDLHEDKLPENDADTKDDAEAK